MAMTRADSADYLAGTLAQLLTDAGLDDSDDPGGLKEIIDDALLMVGTAYDDLATATVASADVLGYRAVLRYAGLLRTYDAILNRVDIQASTPSVSKNRSQFVRQMENRIRLAKEAAEPFITDSGAWGSGTFTLGDWIEPVAS